jgi:hypothetical protein
MSDMKRAGTALNAVAAQNVMVGEKKQFIKDRWTSPHAIILYFALIKLLIHLFTNGQYGYFRDELYFLACSEHLDWGYVDFAPLVAVLTKVSLTLFGDSLQAIRFLPAVAGALLIVLTGLITMELGGKRFAVMLSCLCVLVAPIYLANDTLLTMNAFEPLFWMGAVYCLILTINREDPRYMIGFGLFIGFGLQNKHTMLLLIIGLLIGLLLTRERHNIMTNKWLLAAGLIAIAIFLPNVIWQHQHNWPTIAAIANVAATAKNMPLSPLDFTLQQFILLLPFTAPVWIAGLGFFFFDDEGKRYRMLGIAYVVMLVIMFVTSSKNYYIMSAYPMLFAGGAVLLEKLLAEKRTIRWLKVAYPLVLIVTGGIFAPMALPVLPVDTYITYQQTLGLEPPKTEVGHVGPLPQHYGDMFGWPEMVETVAGIYHNLPPDDRAKAAIFARNYGEAGAIDFFGPRYGLPKAISGHQNYYLWGPRNYTGEVIIVLGYRPELANRTCGSVEEVGTVGHPYAMAEEHYTIFICRNVKGGLQETWPERKIWN